MLVAILFIAAVNFSKIKRRIKRHPKKQQRVSGSLIKYCAVVGHSVEQNPWLFGIIQAFALGISNALLSEVLLQYLSRE